MWAVLMVLLQLPSSPRPQFPWPGWDSSWASVAAEMPNFNFQQLRLLPPKIKDLQTSLFSKYDFFWAVTFLCAMHWIVWSFKLSVCSPHTHSCCFYQPCCHCQLWDISFPWNCSNISRGHYCLRLPGLRVLPVVACSIPYSSWRLSLSRLCVTR